MQTWMLELLNGFGYVGIFFLILIENLFPPIPSEVILTFGGFMTTYTQMQVVGVVLASTAGSVVGAVILYYAGRLISEEKLVALVEGPVGRLLHFEKQDVLDAMVWFEKKGRVTVLVCRCIPIIRSVISIPAGMARMPMGIFLVLTTIGSLIWNTALVCAGAVAGASWEKVIKTMSSFSDITLVAIVVAMLLCCALYFGKRAKAAE